MDNSDGIAAGARTADELAREGSLRYLLLEDSQFDAELATERVRQAFPSSQPAVVSTGHEFEKALRTIQFDLVLADYQVPDFSGDAALELAMKLAPAIPCICVSGAIGEESATRLLRNGAADYVSKHKLHMLPFGHRAGIEGCL